MKAALRRPGPGDPLLRRAAHHEVGLASNVALAVQRARTPTLSPLQSPRDLPGDAAGAALLHAQLQAAAAKCRQHAHSEIDAEERVAAPKFLLYLWAVVVCGLPVWIALGFLVLPLAGFILACCWPFLFALWALRRHLPRGFRWRPLRDHQSLPRPPVPPLWQPGTFRVAEGPAHSTRF
eukprot:EG_transcript_30435